MRYKTFAINVKSNEYRRNHIMGQQEKSGLEINIFEAITPETLHTTAHKYTDKRSRRFTGRCLKETEKACAMSHITLWRQLLNDSKVDYYLIIEDDANITDNLAGIIDSIDFSKIDFLKLSGKIKRKKRLIQKLANDLGVYKYSFGPLDTAAYMINKKAAKRLIDYCEYMFTPVDIMMDRSFDHGVPIYGVYPYPIEAEFCFDENSPMYTSIGQRNEKYAEDITFTEKFCKRYFRLISSLKRKIAILKLQLE